MMGSFLTRGLVMALGYTYPAYECYKSVEKNKPEIEQLRFWCQYWILVAMLTVFERIGGDAFISWLPMYSEAKLAFFVYLWYPKTSGTTYVYDTFLRPFVAKHEMEIDRNLMELRARAGDIALMSWQKAASYGQTRVFEILQFVASQSSRPRPAQQPQRAGVRQPPPATSSTNKSPATPTRAPAKQQSQPPAVGQPATSAAADQRHELRHEAVPKPAASTETVDAQTTVPDPVTSSDATSQLAVPSKATSQSAVPSKATSQSAVPSKEEVKEIESAPVQLNGSVDPPPQDKVMDEAIRVPRGRLRKTRAASNR